MRPPSPTPTPVDPSPDRWPMVRPARLETERLLLRPWRDADLAPFAALNADARVMEHFPSVLDRLDSDAAAGRFRAAYARRGYGLWAVEVKGGAPFIGFAGLAPAPDDLPFAPAMEIGWRLAADHWGVGYATEAARAALAFAFERLRLPEIVSFTVPENVRSIAVMRKIGLARDPAGDFLMPARRPGRVARLHVLYRLRRPEG
ncbi:GNAT family N-acetyltransferase [Salinarimonas ramus]|uniref:N-acetyltransferase n=1 Tax=Salinarimonas ramus TaxID=690164 RepID=A0A917V2Q0_9HYPH|nr:GNAT family N-acetyltransferase [Salinarimonas ramus]GGK24445.1 N-acetyltransferase [Salinarimonas ramus]